METTRRAKIDGNLIRIGAWGIFAKRLSATVNEAATQEWLALEDLCYEIEWCIGIYSAYDLIRWGKTYGLLKASEYEAWFNLLQN